MGLGSSLRKPETSQDTHTSELLPAPLFPMSCCQHLQEVGSWWGSTSAEWKRHLWGAVCGGGLTVAERERFRGCGGVVTPVYGEMPCPLLGGSWAWSTGPRGGTARPSPCMLLVAPMRSQDLGVWLPGHLPRLLQIGASSPSLCQVPGGHQVPSCRPAQTNQMGTTQ